MDTQSILSLMTDILRNAPASREAIVKHHPTHLLYYRGKNICSIVKFYLFFIDHTWI